MCILRPLCELSYIDAPPSSEAAWRWPCVLWELVGEESQVKSGGCREEGELTCIGLLATIIALGDETGYTSAQIETETALGKQRIVGMSSTSEPPKDFFLGYTGRDRTWAEWIAFTLEEAGYTTVIQAWDSRPGMNFVAMMNDATRQTQRTLAVLSAAYLESEFGFAEWAVLTQPC